MSGPRARSARRRLLGRLLALTVWVTLGSLAVSAAGAPRPAVGRPAPGSGVWPLRPRPAVVKGFDPPAERWGSGHRGVDLAGYVGEPVHAALAGRVTFAGRLAGVGVVVVDHGGTRTTYEPVVASVQVGAQVATGEIIGHLALFGSHCFPRACLHWGLIEGRDHYLDPLLLVGAAPVILLPSGPLPTSGGAVPIRSWPRPAVRDLSGRLGRRPVLSEGGAEHVIHDTLPAPVRPRALREPLLALGWR